MATCYVCQKPKAALVCGSCKNDICKNCTQFVDEDRFAFMSQRPEVLSHPTYCNPCYDAYVVPQMAEYDALVKKAEQIQIFEKNQGKETRLFKRLEPAITVQNCLDREETLLRLAFMAVEKDFNGVIDVDIVSEKVRNGTYQTLKWSGTGIPSNIPPSHRGWR